MMLCGLGGSVSTVNTSSIIPVNECVLRPGICGGGRCIDTPDSFTCDCYQGYYKKKSDDAQVCEGSLNCII